MNRLLITLSICVFTIFQSNNLFAQDIEKLLKKGKKELENERDIEAYNYFLDVLYQDPENSEAKYYAGICHLIFHSPKKALEYFEEIQTSEVAKSHPAFNYYLAKANHMNGNFDKAEELLKGLDGLNSPGIDVQNLKEQITSAKDYLTKEEPFIVKNLGSTINTRHHEYSTIAFSDHKTILYTSRNDFRLRDSLRNNPMDFENIYIVSLDDHFNWSTPEPLTNVSQNGNDATVQIISDDTQIVTYYNGDLYISEIHDGMWEAGQKLKGINTPANESHCFFTNDGNTIYFSSNFESYDGNLDLYVAHYDEEEKEWSEPVPLIGLNTPYDEDAPYIAEDGTFYFASKGHGSMGGFDIFKTSLDEENEQWEKPVNMGSPINSLFDDLYFITFGKMAYFSSSRTGGFGGQDLYQALLFNNVEVAGQAIDKETNQPLVNQEITIELDNKQTITTTTDKDGKYTVSIPVNEDTKSTIKGEGEDKYLELNLGKIDNELIGYKVALADFSIEKTKGEFIKAPPFAVVDPVKIKPKNNGEEKEFELPSNKTQMNEEPEMLASNDSKNSAIGKKISKNVASMELGKPVRLFMYFDLNASVIKEVFYSQLDEISNFLQENNELIIEVGGHTDNLGSYETNMQLSDHRAKAIALYIIESGIEKERVVAKGYGETVPIASNDDEEDGRELNRRVELKLLNAKGNYSVTN
ncbi:MAG: OmpA family protein [Flammeovirgaceae bacterium]|nr:OmpA family protein [Flammeovirgaceae bacterium]